MGNNRRLGSALLLAGVVVFAIFLGSAFAQTAFNEHEVTTEANDPARSNVWSLDFRFKDPRMIKVNVPGRGTRICWYLWYQVINRTRNDQTFAPSFEIVTQAPPASYKDEILPTVEDAIKRLEDPSDYLNIHNSVSISTRPIPMSKPAGQAYPRAVTGIAIWDGSPADLKNRDPRAKDLSDATRFSIFVRGLSNGSRLVDPVAPGLPSISMVKTLQLNFRRQGDRFSTDSRDISFVAPAEWQYRAANYSKAIDKK